jgi:hypothetical protein
MSEPTARMKRLYRQLLRLWGEPDEIIVFDRAAAPSAPIDVHVALWHPDDDCDITSFNTLGMSECRMAGADYLAEVNLGIRGPRLPDSTWRALAAFVANVACYPFEHDLKLDWWESLKHPGAIPGFPGFTQLLVAASLDGEGLEWFDVPDDDVKLLRLVPITPRENHLFTAHGRQSLLDYAHGEAVDLYSPLRK